ncbi:MAG: transcriptional regulator [Candidatus Diapherotrites archaeon CG08_land_8_20_14_0_20_34_12]|nr:MAG: transcriptional regulator [Candidatus Diapherotrites archaeon CG08_land_8_20_14_0_20_34_12]
MAYELDLKDRKILFELDRNSRKSYSEIAKKVGLSKQVVKFRIERMVERGIIEEFITTWNIGALGYTDYAILFKFKGATKDDENQIINYFKESNNVSWVVSTEGHSISGQD